MHQAYTINFGESVNSIISGGPSEWHMPADYEQLASCACSPFLGLGTLGDAILAKFHCLSIVPAPALRMGRIRFGEREGQLFDHGFRNGLVVGADRTS